MNEHTTVKSREDRLQAADC